MFEMIFTILNWYIYILGIIIIGNLIWIPIRIVLAIFTEDQEQDKYK